MVVFGRMSEVAAGTAGTAAMVVSHVRWMWWCRAGGGVGLGIRRGARSLSTAPRCELVASEPGLLTLRRRPATFTATSATFAATRIGAISSLESYKRSTVTAASWKRREYATMASATSFYEFKPKDSEFALSPSPPFLPRGCTRRRGSENILFPAKPEINILSSLPLPPLLPAPPSPSSFHTNPRPLTEKGQAYDLSQLSNKVVLVVNTASKCGFTPQFEGLEKLYKDIKSKYPNDFEIIGFPCNQFGGQDPGTNEEIQEFCQVNYGVSFPVLGKIDVRTSLPFPPFLLLFR